MENKPNNKIDNFGTFGTSDLFFTKIANNQFTTHRYSKEWKAAIVLAFLFSLITSWFSISGGYSYVNVIIFQLTENKAVTFISSILVVVFLEYLVYMLIGKFFKFTLKFIPQTAIPVLIFTLLVYSISFYISTQGMSISESKKVDKTELINENKSIEISNLQRKTDSDIDYLKNQIETIKANPAGWQNGQRNILTKEQLQTIKQYNASINEVKQALRTDIKNLEKQASIDKTSNLKEVTSTASKYHQFMSVMMLTQFVAGGFLMFSWSKIQSENEPEKHIKSKVIDISLQYKSLLNNFLMSELNTIKNGFALALNEHEIETIPFEIENSTKNTASSDYKETEKKIGFQIINKANLEHKATDKKVCEHCGKDISDKKHWNAKFCNYECRKAHWEHKTGVKLKLKKPQKP